MYKPTEPILTCRYDERESPLNRPKNLTELYRQFYRANKRYNPEAERGFKPDRCGRRYDSQRRNLFREKPSVSVVAAEVAGLMNRVHASTAEGRWILSDEDRKDRKYCLLLVIL
jgi:CRISPR-associated protein Csc3